jgi:hypothetical protein
MGINQQFSPIDYESSLKIAGLPKIWKANAVYPPVSKLFIRENFMYGKLQAQRAQLLIY